MNDVGFQYNGCVWKGGRLRLEKAKEHFLNRLRREWAEDVAEDVAAAVAAVADAQPAAPDSSQAARNLPVVEKSNLRIFFPRLRKVFFVCFFNPTKNYEMVACFSLLSSDNMELGYCFVFLTRRFADFHFDVQVKLLPFSGTGKHKYSFQRVDVPSLPKYFCDCEEHAGPFSDEIEKRIRHQEAEPESGGVNQEELSIMNKVMNSLFQKQNDGSIDDGTLLADSGDKSFKSSDELHMDEDEDEDEDNLILNVVTKGNDDMFALLGRQQGHQVSDQV